jgi:hypothetical protein
VPAARRSRTAPNNRESTRGYYDVVLKGTFEVRMSRISSGNQTNAVAAATRELESYAEGACQGDNTIKITGAEAKRYTRKVEMTVMVDAANVDKAKELVTSSLGEKVHVKDAFMEHVRSRGRGY